MSNFKNLKMTPQMVNSGHYGHFISAIFRIGFKAFNALSKTTGYENRNSINQTYKTSMENLGLPIDNTLIEN